MNCIFSNSDCSGNIKYRMPLAAAEKSAIICEYHWQLRQHDVRTAASDCECWKGYERVPGTKPCAPGSCRKKKKSSMEKEAKPNKSLTNRAGSPMEYSGGASEGDTSWDEGGFMETPAIDHGRREDDPETESTPGLDQPIPSVNDGNTDKGVSEEEPSFEGTKDDEFSVMRTPGTPKTRLKNYVVDSEDRGAFQLIVSPPSSADDMLDSEGRSDSRDRDNRGQRGIQDPRYLIQEQKAASKLSSDDSFVPPSSVASNAKRGLKLRKEHGRGGTEVGVARARDLSNRKGLSYSTVKRMKAYFDRHEVDKKGEGWGKDSAGYIAWLLWGGDAGRSWANKIIKQHEKESSIKESYMKLCAACGTATCLGHEQDSVNYMILVAHASEDHSSCHPDGCDSVGRSFHAHICTNCGGDTPCVGTRTASVCDTFDGFCRTCFATLSGVNAVARKKVDKKKINKHRRMRNTGAPAATQAEVDRAMGAGHSFEQARKEVGPHRPKVEASLEPCPDCGMEKFVCQCDKNYVENPMAVNASVKLADPGSIHNITGPDIAQYLTTLLGTGVATVAVTSLFDQFKQHMTKGPKKSSIDSIKDVAHAFLQWTVDNPSAIAGSTQGVLLGGLAKLYLNKLKGKGEQPPSNPSTTPKKIPVTTQSGPYDQDSELIVRDGDGSHTFIGLDGVAHQWHPGVQTRRGSEELPDWLKEAKKIISEDSGEKTEGTIAPVIDLDAKRQERSERIKRERGNHPSMLGPKTEQPSILDSLQEHVTNLQKAVEEMERRQAELPSFDDLFRGMADAPRAVKEMERRVLEELARGSETSTEPTEEN